MHFQYMILFQYNYPCYGVMKFTILVDPSMVTITIQVVCLKLCLGVEQKIFIEIIHFHYMIYMAMPQHKNPCPGGHEIYNFGGPFLGHHLICLNHAPVQRRRSFRKYINFTLFTLKLPPPQAITIQKQQSAIKIHGHSEKYIHLSSIESKDIKYNFQITS